MIDGPLAPPPMGRWGGARAWIFSMPYTDIKVLTIIDSEGVRGAIYDPGRLTHPMPWLAWCPHCRDGRQKGLSLKIRKAVQVLCTIRPDGPDGYSFTLPNRYRIGARRTLEGWGLRIERPDGAGDPLYVIKRHGSPLTRLRDASRSLRSPLLLRTLRLILSAEEADEENTTAILLPMREHPYDKLPRAMWTPCRRAMQP